MAVNALFENLRNKVKSVYNNFFFDGEEERLPSAPAYEPPMEYAAQQPAQQPYQAQYQQPQYQAAYSQPAPAYQAPAQPQQVVYQQPAPQQQQPTEQPAAQQPRNRRMWAHQNQDNVVDFNAYQAAQGQTPEQPAPEAQPNGALHSARIINARGMGDCRSAITLLRNGDAVLIVLENVGDPAEMRRLVDTLSGACYSLTATITKVSRYGVYLLAPQSMAVYADQTTNQMNGAPARQPQPRAYQQAGYAPQQQSAPGIGYQQQQTPFMPPAQQQRFAPRTAVPQEPIQPFYSRPAPQAAAAPAFAAQPAGYGYAPDETAALEQ